MINESLIIKFKSEMSTRSHVMWDLAINFNYAKHLYTTFNTGEIDKNWSQIRHVLFRVLVIDLSKIFTSSKNQKFNLFILLDKLENGEFEELGFQKSKINNFRNILNKYSTFFTTIKKFRDEVFAHTDKEAFINPGKEFFPTLEILIDLAYEIMNESAKIIPGTQLYFNPMNKTDLSKFVQK